MRAPGSTTAIRVATTAVGVGLAGELRASLRAAHQRLVLGDEDGWQASNLARIRARAALETLFGRAPLT